MLVMRRREGEAILIGEDVEIRILSINRSKVKIGITAPRSVPVSSREIELVCRENQAAAQDIGDASGVVARLLHALNPENISQKFTPLADLKQEE